MEKNGYVMRPIEASTMTTYSFEYLPSPKVNNWAPTQVTNEFITEEWRRVNYIPREHQQKIKQSLVTGTDLSPMGQMSTIYRDVSYEYKQISFVTRMMTDLNNFSEGIYNILSNHYIHKTIIKP